MSQPPDRASYRSKQLSSQKLIQQTRRSDTIEHLQPAYPNVPKTKTQGQNASVWKSFGCRYFGHNLGDLQDGLRGGFFLIPAAAQSLAGLPRRNHTTAGVQGRIRACRKAVPAVCTTTNDYFFHTTL